MVRPRVIFINRVYWPSLAATAQLLTDLAEGLAGRGWSVQVIAAGIESGSHHGVTIHRTGAGDEHGGLISRAKNYGRFIRKVRTQLQTLLQPNDLVVVMTDPPLLGAAITGMAVKQGAHVIHWAQDIYPEIVGAHVNAIASALLLPLRWKRDAAWRQAATCVTLGDTMAALIAARGVDPKRIALVPNWAPPELHHPPSATILADKRAAWGLSEKFVVAYSGNLGRVHEFSAILDAAGALRDRQEFVFLFIGTGARLDEVRSAVKDRQLPNVRLLPASPRHELAASLGAADVQLVTLKPEFAALVYPSKLAGVLAAARPVIFVGPSPGEIAGLLDRSGSGASFAPEDGERLAEKLRQWQADADLRQAISRHARSLYEGQFSFDAALQRWEEILIKAAARESRE